MSKPASRPSAARRHADDLKEWRKEFPSNRSFVYSALSEWGRRYEYGKNLTDLATRLLCDLAAPPRRAKRRPRRGA